MSRGTSFTRAEIDALYRLAAAGKTPREIATTLGRPYETVRSRLRPNLSGADGDDVIRAASMRFAEDGARVFGGAGV